MRVRLPLKGFSLFKMNWMIHFALWIGSHYAVSLNYTETSWFPDFDVDQRQFDNYTKDGVQIKGIKHELAATIIFIRNSHLLLLLLQLFEWYMKSIKNDIMSTFFECAGVMTFCMTYLYQVYFYDVLVQNRVLHDKANKLT